jgi:hypothetical protein
MVYTTKIVKRPLPKDGETSATAGTYAKAVNDAIGAGTVVSITSAKQGSYIVTTIVLS